MIHKICIKLEIHPWELPKFIRLSLWGMIKMLAAVVIAYLGTLGLMAIGVMMGGVM